MHYLPHLEDRLKEIGWAEYEAKAYAALVAHGGLKATDLVAKTGVPVGRIYQILEALVQKGAIRKVGKRGSIFLAQNPRGILQAYLDELRRGVDEAVSEAEQAWELSKDRRAEESEVAWTASGEYATLYETRDLLAKAQKEVTIVSERLRWLGTRDVEIIRELRAKGVAVNVLGTKSDGAALKRVASAGATVHQAEEVNLPFCVADRKATLIKLSGPDTCVLLRNEKVAEMFLDRYAELRAEAAPVEVTTIATT